MGLVPQFDCLLGTMTGREHLRLYSRVCGLYHELKDTLAEASSNTSEEEEPLLGAPVSDDLRPLRGEERISAFLALVGISEADADRSVNEYEIPFALTRSSKENPVTTPQLYPTSQCRTVLWQCGAPLLPCGIALQLQGMFFVR